MKMSNEYAVGVLKDLHSVMFELMPEPEKTEICTALQIAICNMHKCEKIEQIHKQWFCDFDSATAYSRISEVLKDG